MADPEFSVVIAVYNGADTIARAIDSVLAQTYSPLEIIVVDDGSTDRTRDVISRYESPVRCLFQDNLGVSRARNAGVGAARGNWLAFLDADDFYYPDRLRWHAELIMQQPELDFLTGDFDYCREDGSFIRRSMESTPLGRKMLSAADDSGSAIMPAHEFGDFVAEHFGDTHTLSLPRHTFNELGGYPPEYQVCEDVYLLIRLCAASRCAGVICRPMAAYTIHGNSATRRDPVYAQEQTIAAMLSIRNAVSNTADPLRDGVKRGLRRARLDLAYALLRDKRRLDAIKASLPLLVEYPGLGGLRDVLSVARGLDT